MILVDSGVWIDYFNGKATRQTQILDALLGVEPLGICDLILTEVLQGFRADANYKLAKKLLTSLDVFDLLGEKLAIKSAENFRALRKRGITVRKTADVIIATYCIEAKYPLFFSDKDFLPFTEHLGLRAVL